MVLEVSPLSESLEPEEQVEQVDIFLDAPLVEEVQQPASAVNFVATYLDYTNKTECPTFFHRWAAITSLAAYLGRSMYFRHGHFTIYPNMYTLLIGSPGARKSSAIKMSSKLLGLAGYDTFAAKKTRQEKFLEDLALQSDRLAGAGSLDLDTDVSMLEQNLWGEEAGTSTKSMYIDREPTECFIAADEFNVFLGLKNLDFISLLGDLWDFDGVYDYRLKNAKSLFIPYPSISILGGTTATGFDQAFPPETAGQGFFSRLLLVYGEPTGVKYTFPPPPDLDLQRDLIGILHRIKAEVVGEVTMTDESRELLDIIYHSWEPLEDLRFEHYSGRRLSHLIKLCMVVAASRISTEILPEDIRYANAMLTYTESLMPKALGEFGKARNSGVSHTIVTAIDQAMIGPTPNPISFLQIWKLVHQDLESRLQLAEILSNLTGANKIQDVGDQKYLPVRKVMSKAKEGTIDLDLIKQLEDGAHRV
ncbi:MAG: hypothetical protein COB66_01345 [Coxiella sp. (in: Bacteria)]|nr:MAG: hypothetical protein COB66_01345 [Coxiella sp. (in: g-proteobacteria)]